MIAVGRRAWRQNTHRRRDAMHHFRRERMDGRYIGYNFGRSARWQRKSAGREQDGDLLKHRCQYNVIT